MLKSETFIGKKTKQQPCTQNRKCVRLLQSTVRLEEGFRAKVFINIQPAVMWAVLPEAWRDKAVISLTVATGNSAHFCRSHWILTSAKCCEWKVPLTNSTHKKKTNHIPHTGSVCTSVTVCVTREMKYHHRV